LLEFGITLDYSLEKWNEMINEIDRSMGQMTIEVITTFFLSNATITRLVMQQKEVTDLPNPDEDTLAILGVLSGLYSTAYFFGADALATITTFG